MRVLVDTNIFLDILLERKDLMSESLNVLDKLYEDKDQIYVSASSFKDIYYFANKLFHDSFLAHKYVIGIYSKITKIISLTSDDVIEAIYQKGDFENNCLIESAKRTMCDAIITRNVKDFANKNLLILDPAMFFKLKA